MIQRIAGIGVILLLIPLANFGQRTLTGKVLDSKSHEPLIGVTVYLPDIKAGTSTNATGKFTFNNVPTRKVLVQATYIGYKTYLSTVTIDDNNPVTLEMEPSVTEINEVVITGNANAVELKRTPSPISVISKNTLARVSSTNIIDAIASQPGISQITTGAGISKPVIRGLGYNRVLVVNDGVRQEGQQWGDEHGVEIDENNVDRVEILKGPASLAYGSDALAGVINFIPKNLPTDGKVTGNVSSEYQTNNGLVGSSASVAGNSGAFGWDIRLSGKMAHDYKNRYDGYVFNSGFKENAVTALLGIKKGWGYSNLTLSRYDLKPGIVEGDRDDLTGKFIKPVNKNGTEDSEIATSSDFKSYNPSVPFQRITHYKAVSNSYVQIGEGHLHTIFGFQQNTRKEFGEILEPSTPGLYFKLNTLSYDIQYHLPEINGFSVATGVNGMYQNSSNLGEEFLVPAYHLFDFGVFAIVKKSLGKADITGGVRFDNRSINSKSLFLNQSEEPVAAGTPNSTERFSAFSSSFQGVSGSLGITYQLSDAMFVKANFSSGYRSPNIAELGSNGVHEGTLRYEIGSASLKAEQSLQADLGIGLNTSHISAELSLFANRINNFIFLHKLTAVNGSDSTIDGSTVLKYSSGDASLYGGEFRFDIHPHPLDWIHFENTFSYVYTLLHNQPDSAKYLPFTPAAKLTSGLVFTAHKVTGSLVNAFFKLDAESTFAQHNIYSAYNTETATPGYLLLNSSVGSDFAVRGKTWFSFQLGVNNLTDKAYQSHLSRLKYAPENKLTGRTGIYNMGRNFTFKLNIPIG